MPRYDDGYGNTRLYVGRLSSRTRSRDLDRLFSRYGRVRDVDMKRDFAFVEFSDPRDADDARYSLDGREFDGVRLVVEFARGGPRGSREYVGRGPTPGSGRCFNCGIDGHWARDCKAGDWKNKCYRCGERGHIERQCKNSPKELKRGRSQSPLGSRSPRRGRSRSPSYSPSRSYSRSRSPVRRGRSEDRYDRSASPAYRKSPVPSKRRRSPTPDEGSPRSPVPSKRNRSTTPDEGSPRGGGSPSARNGNLASPRDGSDYSPRGNSRSPVSPMEKSRTPGSSPGRDSPVVGKYPSPTEADNAGSPSPREDRSPAEYDDDN